MSLRTLLKKLSHLVAATALLSTALGAGALRPPSTGGVGELHNLLSRLGTHRRLLVIGAHPDDEDTGLLTPSHAGLWYCRHAADSAG